jgi:hypothetical protein
LKERGADYSMRSGYCEAEKMTTIKESMEALGFEKKALDSLPVSLKSAYFHFAEWKVDSHCGSECQRILSLAVPLLEAADPAARPDIWRGVVSALAIICVG